jgi:spore coat protein H
MTTETHPREVDRRPGAGHGPCRYGGGSPPLRRRAWPARTSALLLLLGCAASPKPAAPDAGGETGVAVDHPCGWPDPTLRALDAAELFGAPQIPHFDVYLPAADWEVLKANARAEEYVPAQACFEGRAIGLVGLRFKGSYGSLYNCFDDSGANICRKLGMKLKFDEYVDEQRFYGLKRLNFQGYRYDDSYLKERLSYDLYRAMDIVAPRAAWAVLRVNGEPQGLFGMVEQVDGRFTADRWPASPDGNLYKERWPGDTDETWIRAGLETNKDPGDVSSFIGFSTALAAAAEADLRTVLGRFTDLDYFARYMAVDDAIANFDGITTYYTSGAPDEAGNHNFYLYEESAGRFTIVPWDLESTMSLLSRFGNVPSWQTLPADCTQTYPVWQGDLDVIAPACDRVFRALAADLTSYRAAARVLLDGPFAEATMLASIDAHAAFIRGEAVVDPHGPGATDFENAVAFLRKEVPNLRRRLEYLLSGLPLVPLELGVGVTNDFEAADPFGITLGTTSLSNPNSTVGVTLNEVDPLVGAKTLRIVFAFGNEAKAWQQWLFYQVPFARPPADLSGLTGIRLQARSNEPRMLRLDVDSPANSAASEGVEVGWDVPVDATRTTVTVRFADAKVPGWAVDPGDSLADILRTASGLTFRPQCNHRDATGQLPAGTTDVGWLEIDDLEVF